MTINRSRIISVVAALLLSINWLGAAHAAPIVVDWDVVPHDTQEIHYGDSPYYDCEGQFYEARLCQSLWDTGLTLEAVLFSFYDDKFVDGFGIGDPEEAMQRIRPECKAGLDPCFDSFTPTELRVVGEENGGPFPNLFVTSSRGGVMRLPSVNGLVSFNFAGSAWQDLDWLEIGFYLPESCDSADPPEDPAECNAGTEKAFTIQDLTFEAVAVPEPALLSLLAAGALGVGMRRRYRA